jgi:acetyl-CoA C-acetyltransferase
MAVDPRQPVLVGVGQVNHEGGDAPEPVELIAEAVRRAGADAGAPALVGQVQSVEVIRIVSRAYPDPGALVAELAGVRGARTVLTTDGGQTAQALLDRAARRIHDGELDAVLVCGGESWRTRNRIRARGESSPWRTQPEGTRPDESFGAPLDMTSADEAAVGLTDPVQAYPMVENALRARHGRTIGEQQEVAARLWAGFSEVAAGNPYAAIRRIHTAEEIATVGPANRMIGFPYPKLMNSNSSVDQAAALLVCSAERARATGVPPERWVFLQGAGEADDVHHLSNRWDLASSPAIRTAGAAALDLAGVGVDDLAHVDLYSCFPSAVQVAAAELGLGLDRPLTVTGGLTFAGGPWNAYVLHSVATMAGRLREEPDAYGLVSANGGLLTKHAVGVYGCRPPAAGSRVARVQDRVDALPRRDAAPDHRGGATIETYTVEHDREGRPVRAIVAALLADGRRVMAAGDDTALLDRLLVDGAIGTTVTIADGRVTG